MPIQHPLLKNKLFTNGYLSAAQVVDKALPGLSDQRLPPLHLLAEGEQELAELRGLLLLNPVAGTVN